MRICVGRITKPHGIKGQTTIEPFTSSSTFFLQSHVFFTENNREIKLIKPFINGKNFVISMIENFPDRTAVEKLNNTNLYVDRKSLPDLDEASNEYYFEDLKHMTVVDETKNIIGTVTNVCDFGAGIFIEISLTNKKEATIQFNKDTILDVSLESKLITIDSKFLLF